MPLTADTSVVVPSLADWHESHEVAWEAAKEVTQLPSHVALETVSVLTRLPHGLAVSPAVAVEAVARAFPETPWTISSTMHSRLVARIGDAGLRGGLVYDALVAAIAVQAGVRLLSLDRRATPAYQAVGAEVVFLG